MVMGTLSEKVIVDNQIPPLGSKGLVPDGVVEPILGYPSPLYPSGYPGKTTLHRIWMPRRNNNTCLDTTMVDKGSTPVKALSLVLPEVIEDWL